MSEDALDERIDYLRGNMSEVQQAAAKWPSLRHRWPRGVFGLMAYLIDHCVYRFDYPVSWHDLRACEESSSAFVVSMNGGVSVFDGVETDILRGLLRREDDRALADRLGVRLFNVANVRAKLRRDLGISTGAEIAQLAREYKAWIKC